MIDEQWWKADRPTKRELLRCAFDPAADADRRVESLQLARSWFPDRFARYGAQLERIAFDPSQSSRLRGDAIELISVCSTRAASLSRRLGQLIEHDPNPAVVFWAAYGFFCVGRRRDRVHLVRRLRNRTDLETFHMSTAWPNWTLENELLWALACACRYPEAHREPDDGDWSDVRDAILARAANRKSPGRRPRRSHFGC